MTLGQLLLPFLPSIPIACMVLLCLFISLLPGKLRPPKVKRILASIYPLGVLGIMSFVGIGYKPITPYLKAMEELLYAEKIRPLDEILKENEEQ